jgi:flagellar biosynthesis protein FlhF
MRLKSFIADSVPEAMRLVREQLGPDAVVLSTQEDGASGKIRITAALEETPLDELRAPPAQGELRSIDDLSEVLHHHRVPIGLLDRLLGAAGRLSVVDPLTALAGALDAVLDFTPAPEIGATRPILLAGPPGAGKTATAAKLCTRVRLAGRQSRLITMDSAKAGGLAQIATFAEALEARLDQAEDVAALSALLAAGTGGDFVVIDTMGCNPLDDAERRGLAAAAAAVQADLALVLPAGGDVLEAAESAVAFAEAGAGILIPTKLDTTRRLGSVLSAAFAGGLALVAAGVSPSIAEGLAPLNPMALARLLLAGAAGAAEPEPKSTLKATGTLP